MRVRPARWLVVACAFAGCVGLSSRTATRAQTPLDRLPAALLDVRSPSSRVAGEPGRMTVRVVPCRTAPLADVGRRIVDVAVQEWGFFGFKVVDHTAVEDDDAEQGWPRRRPRLSPEESLRVASTIAGYWSVTPSGGWILGNQNTTWNGPDGVAARWRYPWSAGFISWVMCEGGLGSMDQFSRAVAHHTYIDQAIRAREQPAGRAAFVAYDRGETTVRPGDLLCTARRPAYRSLADRRRQMGQGARTHCDVVVRVDETAQRVLAIGGNVRGSVSLKVLPMTSLTGAASLAPGARPIFAHLKLRVGAAVADAFDHSPTLKALDCGRRQVAPCGLSTDD
jgi:hypothetical protein